jgi:prepilin-type N-terminal cleavage/methylation domain-containing protein
MHFRNRGVTLVELVTVLVLVSVVSATVVLNIGAQGQHSVTVQADQFRRDLSHIQLLALSRGTRLKLTVAAGSYSVCTAATSTCNAASAITDPATGAAFDVALTDGVQFTAGHGSSYFFDSLGRPASAATGATLVTTTTTFSLNGVGRATAVDITVLPVTGFARTNYN